MTIRLRHGLLTAALASAALTGCANFHKTAKSVDRETSQAKIDVSHMSQPLPVEGTGRFVESGAIWTSDEAIVNSHGRDLPSSVEAGGVTLASSAPMTLPQIANFISEKTGITVSLSDDLKSGGGRAVSLPSGMPGAGAVGAAGAINSTLANANGGHAPGGASFEPLPSAASLEATSLDTSGDTMAVNYSGSLSGFLNTVADRFGVSWTYDGVEIKIFRDVTRTWTIDALPSAEKTDASMSSTNSLSGGGSSGGSGAAGIGQALKGSYSTASSAKMSVNVWADVLSGLKNVVGGQGTINATPSTGTLTVTAPPAVMQKVRNYIAGQNERLSRMVAVTIRVLTVTATRSDTNQFNLNQVFSSLGKVGAYSLNLGNSGAAAASAATSLSTSAPGLAFGVLSPTSGVSGTNLIASALSQLGKVGTLYDTAVTTMNGIPAPIQVSHTQAYLASVSTTNLGGASGGSQQQLTPGVVTTGVSFNVTPRVDPGQDGVLLNFSMTVSALVGPNNGFNIVSSGGQELELPDIDSQEFSQEADLKSGSTVVLAGYNQVSNTINRSGVGDPYNFLLGGSGLASRKHQIVVLLLTPVVVKTPEMIRESHS